MQEQHSSSLALSLPVFNILHARSYASLPKTCQLHENVTLIYQAIQALQDTRAIFSGVFFLKGAGGEQSSQDSQPSEEMNSLLLMKCKDKNTDT